MTGRQPSIDPTLDPAEHDEHVAAVLRLRRAVVGAIAMWPVFGLIDWYIVSYANPGGRLWFLLLLRAIGLVVLGVGVMVVLGPRLPGARVIAVVEPLVMTALTVLVTLGCLEYHGIDSPLVVGIVIILLARAAILAQHWRLALPTVAAIALAFPLTLVASAVFSPTMAAEFGRNADRAGFAVNLTFVVAAAAIALFGGHMVWMLRRQVFETRSLGRYRLKQRIGKGGMGEVWLAHHHALRRDVAVKIIRADERSDPTARARFELEVRATAELVHPNTVRVFDYGVTDDGLCYYAMELLAGEDLAHRVARRGPSHPAEVVRLGWQAARALGEAHDRGIVHRDIKPENLFVANVAGEEMIKVLDFGLAKLAAGAGSPNLTLTGWAVGTPRWTAPEVIVGRQADPRTDVYSLGAVLYFAITGTPPFLGRDVGSLLAAHVDEAVEPPSARLGEPVPAALEAIILRCLEKEPARRFRDAGELAVALAAAAAREAPRALSPGLALAELTDDDESPSLAAGSQPFISQDRLPVMLAPTLAPGELDQTTRFAERGRDDQTAVRPVLRRGGRA